MAIYKLRRTRNNLMVLVLVPCLASVALVPVQSQSLTPAHAKASSPAFSLRPKIGATQSTAIPTECISRCDRLRTRCSSGLAVGTCADDECWFAFSTCQSSCGATLPAGRNAVMGLPE